MVPVGPNDPIKTTPKSKKILTIPAAPKKKSRKQSISAAQRKALRNEEIAADEAVQFLNGDDDDALSSKHEKDEIEEGELVEDGEEEVSEEQPWLATSRKRKEVFDRSNAHLQPLAKKPRFVKQPIVEKAVHPVPVYEHVVQKKRAANQHSAAVASSSSPKSYPKIDWAARKEQLAMSDNIAYVDPLMEYLFEVFHDVAREVRGDDLNKTGPVFLWDLLPAFMKAIEDTPWGYWFDARTEGETGERDYVMFIQWPYKFTANILSDGQAKFRQSCLGKVAILFEDRARIFFANDRIRVIWSKSYGENKPYPIHY